MIIINMIQIKRGALKSFEGDIKCDVPPKITPRLLIFSYFWEELIPPKHDKNCIIFDKNLDLKISRKVEDLEFD